MDIQIENFKGITTFRYNNVSPLTILSGVNSGGKTSFIQSLLMLKQSYEQGDEKHPIILNGKYTKLGSFKDVLNRDNKDVKKDIAIEYLIEKKDFTTRELHRLSHILYMSNNRQEDKENSKKKPLIILIK